VKLNHHFALELRRFREPPLSASLARLAESSGSRNSFGWPIEASRRAAASIPSPSRLLDISLPLPPSQPFPLYYPSKFVRTPFLFSPILYILSSSRVGAVELYTVLWTVVVKYMKWRFSALHRTKTPLPINTKI
jgi:hypothetical protein